MKKPLAIVVGVTLGGCTGNPDFDLTAKSSEYGSAVFRIASIMANVKCELWDAANSERRLPSFRNDTDLRPRHDTPPDLKWHREPADLSGLAHRLSAVLAPRVTAGRVRQSTQFDGREVCGMSPLSLPRLGPADCCPT